MQDSDHWDKILLDGVSMGRKLCMIDNHMIGVECECYKLYLRQPHKRLMISLDRGLAPRKETYKYNKRLW